MSLDVLQRVYEAFQSNGESGEADDDFLDPDKHLHFINAYDMPLWNWSTERMAFERYAIRLDLPEAVNVPLPVFQVRCRYQVQRTREYMQFVTG